MTDAIATRANFLYRQHLRTLHSSTDRLFGYLMLCQYAAAVLWAYVTSPLTWNGTQSAIHPHVLSALVLGGLIAAPVVILAKLKPSEAVTRYTISVCQMLMSALLIHVSGGRIETHFHVFGSLAFLAFYRDWKLLIPPTLVVLVDHMARGFYFPASVYGVSSGAEWRFLEHAAWVVFEDTILVASCLRGVRELKMIAQRQAQLEFSHSEVEAKVQRRTKQLQQLENRKSAILDHALDGIITMDSRGIITEFNPAAADIFGMAREDAIGIPFTSLLHGGDLHGMFESDVLLNARLITSGLRDGRSFPLELTATAIEVEGGTMYTAFVRDLTEQRKLETDLAHAQKMESIGQLATGVAHEINTPNQYIGDNVAFLGQSFESMVEAISALRQVQETVRPEAKFAEAVSAADQAIEKSDLDFVLEEVPKAVFQAQEGVERVASIILAMKEFSHPGQDMKTGVDVNRVVTSTVTVARNEWKYVADVELDLQPDLPMIQGHPGELGQVVLNLLINAVHAVKDKFPTGAGGKIKISTRAEERNVRITVSDNGCGIPEHAQQSIFEPFFTTKEVGKGTGQGLAISRTVVVQRHDGRIDFETSPGEGTTFHISLPLKIQERPAA